jgi:hypothetical protein
VPLTEARIFVGIDPGVSGGIAAVDAVGRIVALSKMPETERDVFDLLHGLSGGRAVLEFVRSSPQMGVTSAFTFGRGYGALRMALVATEIPFDEVTPKKWQGVMQCRTNGDKSITKARAQELFPGARVTNYVADSLLLAEFCRRTYAGTNGIDTAPEQDQRP